MSHLFATENLISNMKTVKAPERKNSDDVRQFIAKATLAATLVMKVGETMRRLFGLMLDTSLP
ncbi:hypothetical protein [Pseudomonas oryzihabitans]|uniref:hypothetical protein n=1 Tax=Pseudomonas oryzihabitans TaxID=47885 RepID=UPI00285EB994|nr:hypothetical protein [Pseudomonas psychrotolerans]MDR6680002.1 hypothetical protein [Pseudomonas psychrotolerans]